MTEFLNNVNIILASGSFWIPLMFGLVFLFFPLRNKNIPKRFYKIKYMMSAIYLFFAAISLVALLQNTEHQYHFTIRLYVPVVAVFHFVLFTCINTSLINSENKACSKLLLFGLSISTIISAFYLTAYYLDSQSILFGIAYYLIFGLLFCMAIYFSYYFFIYYKKYRLALDNYYSELSAGHLDWVYFSQVSVILMALVVIVLSRLPDSMMILYLAGILVFFTYYGVRIIYYTTRFLDFNKSLDMLPWDRENLDHKHNTASNGDINVAIQKWVQKKSFVQPNITILTAAAEMGTNRTYLSGYLNTFKLQTFKEWIAELRINEAKEMLMADPDIPIGEVSVNVGFTDKSNFARTFSRLTGSTPSEWRNTSYKKQKLLDNT